MSIINTERIEVQSEYGITIAHMKELIEEAEVRGFSSHTSLQVDINAYEQVSRIYFDKTDGATPF